MAHNIDDPLFYNDIADRILSLEDHLSDNKPIFINNDNIDELNIETD